MPQLILYEGKYDPKAFIISFEAAIQSIGGNEAMMAKSLVMVVTELAWTWYTPTRARKDLLLGAAQGNAAQEFLGEQ